MLAARGIAMPFNRPPRIFAEGDLFIEEGGGRGSLFILETGTVEVLRGETVVATIGEPGAIIGEMSVLLDTPHGASVRAKTTVIAHVVENAATALHQHPELTYKVAQILARRLRATTQRLAGEEFFVLED